LTDTSSVNLYVETTGSVCKVFVTWGKKSQYFLRKLKNRVRCRSLELIKKAKAVLLQAWSGPQGSRNLRFLDFMTKTQDGGKVVSLTHRPPLSPGNTPGTHFC
jgi:hypothetical protein